MKLPKAIIVDDERLAREKLAEMLTGRADITGLADSVATARALLETCTPDVVFLDIQMPGGSGFELIPHLTEATAVIFVTAYDAHALKAFDVNAVDYLLKPVREIRLAKALERLEQKQPDLQTQQPLAYDDHLFVRGRERCRFLRLDRLSCITAEGSYSVLWDIDGSSDMVPRSLTQWEHLLPKRQFLRIHRSAIVNLNHVIQVDRAGSQYSMQIAGYHKILTMSRRYSGALRERGL